MSKNNPLMDEITPLKFYLSQNYPNPFKERTVIKFCVPYKTRVQLKVYNSEGKVIKKIIDEEKKPGTYEVEFFSNPDNKSYDVGGELYEPKQDLNDGYYFYRLETDSYTSEKKWFCKNKLL
jgi:hypothetical protein